MHSSLLYCSVILLIIILGLVMWKPTTITQVDYSYTVDEPIDIVYTWVDGGNEEWLEEKATFTPGNGVDNGSNRFNDNEEIKYSLRSVDLFAPWIRNIFIVTYDESSYPSYLNLNHPKIKIIPHSMIFKNQDHLPTYNSHAIEANIGRIPGLSDRFLYANDDAMFGSNITKNDFINMDGTMRIGTGNMALYNNPLIDLFIKGSTTAYAKSWRNLALLLKRDYSSSMFVRQPSHHIQIIDKRILNSIYPDEINLTSSHRFRSVDDIPPIGASLLTAIRTGLAVFVNRSEVFTNDKMLWLEKIKGKRDVKFICVNNETGGGEDNREKYLDFYINYTPSKSGLESYSHRRGYITIHQKSSFEI
jgi:hypothetical protein